jgi:hypothetical protein
MNARTATVTMAECHEIVQDTIDRVMGAGTEAALSFTWQERAMAAMAVQRALEAERAKVAA